MGWFQKYYFGKERKEDFTEKDLPKNRLQLFWQMLKNRFWGLAQVNLQYLLFALPLLAWTMFVFFLLSADMPVEDAQVIWFWYFLLAIPLMAITGPAMAGMTAVVRNWAREEYAQGWDDFFAVFKRDWKPAMGLMFFNGFLLFAFYVALTFYPTAVESAAEAGDRLGYAFYVFGEVAVWGGAMIYVMMSLYLFPMLVTYKFKFRQLMGNAFYLALIRLPYTLLFLVIALLPVIIMILLNLVWTLVLVYGGFGLAFTQFVICSYTNATFDKYINPHIKGAKINQGLRHMDEEESGDQDQPAAGMMQDSEVDEEASGDQDGEKDA